jgi:hypothetical protein
MLVVALGLATLSIFPNAAQARSIYGAPNVQAVVMNNFATRDSQLRSQIANDVSSGLLSPVMANNLTNELNSISSQEQSAMAFGGMSDATVAQLNNMFSDVTNQLAAAESADQSAYGYNGYAAPVVAQAPVCVTPAPVVYTPAPAPVYSPAPFWRGVERDVHQVVERPVERRENNWQANRQFDRGWQANRQPEARPVANNWQANRQPVARPAANNWQANRPQVERQTRVASAPREQARFDAHRR